ncbi:DUF6309 family protein [Streptomyces sp. RGM 3693]|uniref:DUF6309 family protein n=1 Tax=Streptomyces sp. RGM 3693 TaxID=3413284 RepID=UPI003D2C7187
MGCATAARPGARAVSAVDYDGLRVKEGITHLDGLHRMIAWAAWHRLPDAMHPKSNWPKAGSGRCRAGGRGTYAPRHHFARSLSVPWDGTRQRQKQKQRQGERSPCHSQRIARWGACRKPRVTAQNRRPMPQPAEMRARRACVVVDVWGAR